VRYVCRCLRSVPSRRPRSFADTTRTPNAWSAFRSIASYRRCNLVIAGLVLYLDVHAGGRSGTEAGRYRLQLSLQLARRGWFAIGCRTLM
jgi:hypothetical protein